MQLSTNHPTRTERWLAIFAAAVLACDVARSRAADTAAGVANWFETVAEAERLAEADAAAGGRPPPGRPRPGNPPPEPQDPSAWSPVDLNDLTATIDKRNRIVNQRLLDALEDPARRGALDRGQIGTLTDWFKCYFQMREFLPTGRNHPNIGGMTDVLQRAIGQRGDFVEGRILLATCHLYAGQPKDAREQ